MSGTRTGEPTRGAMSGSGFRPCHSVAAYTAGSECAVCRPLHRARERARYECRAVVGHHGFDDDLHPSKPLEGTNRDAAAT